MNWSRLYAKLQRLVVVGCMSILSGGWALLVAGIFKVVFKLDEKVAILYLGLPLFLLILIWSLIYLPRALRKAGMLSDEPSSFGPWLKK